MYTEAIFLFRAQQQYVCIGLYLKQFSIGFWRHKDNMASSNKANPLVWAVFSFFGVVSCAIRQDVITTGSTLAPGGTHRVNGTCKRLYSILKSGMHIVKKLYVKPFFEISGVP